MATHGILTATLVLATLPLLVSVSHGQELPNVRGSILIASDAEFTAENGVVAGSGTEADPYLIAGHTILHTEPYGIRLTGTTAHVVIQDVVVAPWEPSYPAYIAACVLPSTDPSCRLPAAIDLLAASHVTVRSVRLLDEIAALQATSSSGVTLEDSVLRPLAFFAGNSFGGTGIGLLAADTDDVAVRRVTVTDGSGFVIAGGSGITVEESVFSVPFGGNGVSGPGDTLRIVGNRFVNQYLFVEGDIDGVEVVGNRFTGANASVALYGGSGTITHALVCGNLVRGAEYGAGIFAWGAAGLAIVGNALRDNALGADVTADGVRFEQNLVTGSEYEGLWMEAYGAAVHRNSFFSNVLGAHFRFAADATENWWGDASGPSGQGPGLGDPFQADDVTPYDPWLLAPPDLTVDCANQTIPEPPAVEPPTVIEDTVDEALAFRFHFPQDGTSVSVNIDWELAGETAALFFAEYDPADPASGDWGWIAVRFGDVRVGGNVADNPIDIHPPVSGGSVGAGTGFSCSGTGCPKALALVVAGSGDASRTAYRIEVAGSGVLGIETGSAALLTPEDFDDEGDALEAHALLVTASVNVGSVESRAFANGLFGFSGALGSQGTFDVERPSGERESAGSLVHLGDEAGTYTYHVDQVGPDSFGPLALVGDLSP